MTGSIDLTLLRSFAAAARTRSLTAAAMQLGLTQPAVSQHMRRLERATGRTLLRRSTRGVSLTADGEVVLRYAERALAVVEELEVAVSAFGLPGDVRVGLLEDAAESGLAAVLADFCASHPAVTLDVTTACGSALQHEITQGTVDLAVADLRVFGAARHGIRQQETFPLIWAAAPASNVVADTLPVVLYQPPSDWRDAVVDTLAAAGRAWRISFEASSLAAYQAALRAGLGIGAVLPGAVPSGCVELERVPGLPDPPRIDLALYRRLDVPPTPVIQQLERLLWCAIGRCGEM
jgi:DNA-binding transcriptional LysR family regulator